MADDTRVRKDSPKGDARLLPAKRLCMSSLRDAPEPAAQENSKVVLNLQQINKVRFLR